MSITKHDNCEWGLELIPNNEGGHQFYLDQYKPCRLTALRQDPSDRPLRLLSHLQCPNRLAYHQHLNSPFPPSIRLQNYTRELAFTATDWRKRLAYTLVETSVAVRCHDWQIQSSCSLIEPKATPKSAHNLLQALEAVSDAGAAGATNNTGSDKQDNQNKRLYFQILGVYTRAKASVRAKRLRVGA